MSLVTEKVGVPMAEEGHNEAGSLDKPSMLRAHTDWHDKLMSGTLSEQT